jgi:hypothetical protein
MAQDLLHLADVCASLEQESGGGVPEEMTAPPFGEAGSSEIAADPLGKAIECETTTACGEEEDSGVLLSQ